MKQILSPLWILYLLFRAGPLHRDTGGREKEREYRTPPPPRHPRASTHTLALTHAHVCARGAERKLQHNDKVWEHNGLSSPQTEARTSLAPKGQQASPSFHSVPLVIIVQHYNDYSDGLYFANAGAVRKYQRNIIKRRMGE